MFKKEILGKLLFIFGMATFIASLIDIASLLFPLRLGSSQWVYSLVRTISETSIIPMIGILSMISGFYLVVSRENRIVFVFESISTGVCASFALFLIILTLLFSVSFSSVENKMVSEIREKGETLKNQLTAYARENPEVTGEELDKSIKKIDVNLLNQVKSVNKSFLKSNVKIFVNIFVYIAAYILFSLILFKTSIITRKKLYYESN